VVSQRDHWESVYTSKTTDRLGWYKPHLQTSLNWIESLALPPDAPIIDIGGGTSTLVDDLLDGGHQSMTVLDLSAQALSLVRQRLASRAKQVTWLVGDITRIELPQRQFELWHDRAVLHFLTSTEQQQLYRGNLTGALKPGGRVVIGVFSPLAPPRCSGLPVHRYDVAGMKALLGDGFELERDHQELHITPGGVEQMYLYCQFRRLS